MNVLQVTPADVYPPTNGSDHRTHAILSEFRERGDSVHRYSQIRRKTTVKSLDVRRRIEVDDNYVEFRPLNPLFELARVATSVTSQRPSLSSLAPTLRLCSPSKLTELIDWADVVMVRGPWQVSPVATFVEDTPVIYSVHASPQDTAIEQRAFDDADAAIFESEWSLRRFSDRFEVDCERIIAPVATYRSNVRNSFVDTESRERIRESHDIPDETVVGLFVGTVHELNVEAARWLVTMARNARKRGHPIHIFIVGSVGKTVTSPPDNVSVLGFVDDIEPIFDAVDIGLNPATSTVGGPNIKMLDYFARGLPVLSTKRGVRGLDVADGEEAVIAERENFLDALVDLAEDEDARWRLGERARKYVEENHTWDVVSSDLRSDVNEFLARQNRSTPIEAISSRLPLE